MSNYCKTPAQIALMRQAGKILQQTQNILRQNIAPGITTQQLDILAESTIRKLGGRPAFKGYKGFPATICAMTNEQIVHAIPSDTPLQAGDILTIDCGVIWQKWYSDAAFTVIVGGDHTNPERAKFSQAVYQAMHAGIAQAKPGNTTGDIGHAIEKHILHAGYCIVPEYTGHGIGKQMHEDPHIFNYGKPGQGIALKENMTLAIEPIVTINNPTNTTLADGWTVVTADGQDSCQWEHFGVITATGFEVFA